MEFASADAKASASESVRSATPWIDRHPRLTFSLVIFIRWFRLLIPYSVVFLSYCDFILKVSKASGTATTRDKQEWWRQYYPNTTLSEVEYLGGYCNLLRLAAYPEADREKLGGLLLMAAVTRALHLLGSLRAYRELRDTAKLRYLDVAISLIYNKNFMRWRWKPGSCTSGFRRCRLCSSRSVLATGSSR